MQRDSFVMYTAYLQQVELLGMEQRGLLFTAIMRYAATGEEPTLDPACSMAFAFIRGQMDKDYEKYLQTVEARRVAGQMGGRPQKAKKANGFFDNQTKAKKADNDNVNDNVLKEKPPKGGKKKSAKRFSPPTLHDVETYIAEKGYNVDPERFIDHYQSIGWMNGNTPITDWKARVRNWNRSQRQELTTKGMRQDVTARKNRFHNFQEHDYDYNAVMQQAVRQNIERYKQ